MKKWPYIMIFILTIADAVLTSLGITKGLIEEANPILRWFFDHNVIIPSVSVVVFTGFLLLLIYKLKHYIYWINYGLALLAIVKLGVIGLHLRWITQII